MRINRYFLFIILLLGVIFQSTIKAQDAVKIADQSWSTKNLDVSTFRNGDVIPEAKSYDEWKKANKQKTPAWCYYENKTANGTKYGKLYNWWAVNDLRVLAPVGWHIPNNDEWDKMIESLGGKKDAGGKLKSTTWGGDNSIGFNGEPAGLRTAGGGEFGGMDKETFWWSSTPEQVYNMNSIRKTWIFKTSCYPSGPNGGAFCYVRCVKD